MLYEVITGRVPPDAILFVQAATKRMQNVITSYSIHYTKLYEQLVISAARSLGSLGSPDSADALMKLTKDSRATVRVAAVEALSKLPLKG